MTAVMGVAGLALVLAALVDLAWTTIAAGSRSGPLTGRLAPHLWQLALFAHRRRASHKLLSTAGVTIVFAVLATWIALVVLGWWLVFLSSDSAIVKTANGAQADAIGRFYFTGYTVFTLGNGDYRPGGGVWQLATVAATGTGLVLITLAITYLVPVASAVAQRRELASYIASLGNTPENLVVRSWTGDGFGSLPQHLVALAPLIHGARQRHLTYPVLHYFHSTDRESAAAPNMTTLAQGLELLRYAVAPAAQPDAAAIDPVDRALDGFLDTLATAYISPEQEPLALPDISHLRAAGIPTVNDDDYLAATAGTKRRRQLLAAFLADDGWRSSR